MDVWEYLVENWTLSVQSSSRGEFEAELNEYGKDGWELVSIVPQSNPNDFSSNRNQLVFKRRVVPE
ncbi:DUF4177 domain-containing protein [Ornithinibacillus halotolerans]|uniref:DUF4177 domain-containing protein n=1 Tax=Ornithinibacillus halotolerans TaxID=1274357 RepID=A0A916S243_9BACI|nr:DUF4177 domain-containing protein [Ornithinibacillus halotolerans]GGA80840.1 hypothetical protein GCM10008025_25270 [Ornithinibacillus halotolerans]